MMNQNNTNRPEEVTEMNTSDRAAQAKALTLRAIEAVANGVKPETHTPCWNSASQTWRADR